MQEPTYGWWGDDSDLIEVALESEMTGTVETIDGCIVEPDGICPHGFLSPLREAGLI